MNEILVQLCRSFEINSDGVVFTTAYEMLHSAEFINEVSSLSALYGVGCIAFLITFIFGVAQIAKGTKAGLILVVPSVLGIIITSFYAVFLSSFAGVLSGG